MRSKFAFAFITAFAVALAACGKKEEPPKPAPAPAPTAAPAPAPAGVAVSAVSVGKAIGADKKVTAATDSFAKGDTFYASIDTTGSGTATLKAKWTYSKDGQTAVVKEDSMTVNATGPATHEFHVAKPDGWPLGDYEVAVSVDDKPAGTKKFSVK
ncbi:MAG: hypothetical protein NDI88_16035 [Lysobacter sp.]|nr:hypothetical protein [Lysobacter sp.]